MTGNNNETIREFCFEFYKGNENQYHVFANKSFDGSKTYDVEKRFRSDHDGFWEIDEGNSEYEIEAETEGEALLYYLYEYGSWGEYESFKLDGLLSNVLKSSDVNRVELRIEMVNRDCAEDE